MEIYKTPNINANAVPTKGGACSVVTCLPTVWAAPYDTAAHKANK